MNVSFDLLDREYLQAFMRLAAIACFQLELMRMQRTDDPVASEQSFGEWPLPMRTAVLDGEDTSIPLPEDCDFFRADDVAAPLADRDGIDAAQVD